MIEVALFDIDGILTDGTVSIDSSGREIKRLCFDDIDAIFELKRAGIKVGFLSGESDYFTQYVKQRFSPDIFMDGCKDKFKAFKAFEQELKLDVSKAAYVGDSKKDVELLNYVNYSFSPSDAVPLARKVAKVVLISKRGEGVVREVVDFFLGRGINDATEIHEKSILENSKYLDVTYSLTRAPKGNYPLLLCQLLLSEYFKKTGRLLELGCGRGDHLKIFAQLGFDVAGIDMSPRSPELSKGFDIKTANLETDTLPFPKNSFDFVFSKSVIEHMREPSRLMSEAFDALRPGGIAVIMTPSWAHTYWGPFYIDHTHVTPFTARSLEDALNIAGFINVHVEHFHQLPFLWRFPLLKPVIKLLSFMPLPYRPYQKAPWPDGFNKLIRFSKEIMLLAVCKKPS